MFDFLLSLVKKLRYLKDKVDKIETLLKEIKEIVMTPSSSVVELVKDTERLIAVVETLKTNQAGMQAQLTQLQTTIDALTPLVAENADLKTQVEALQTAKSELQATFDADQAAIASLDAEVEVAAPEPPPSPAV